MKIVTHPTAQSTLGELRRFVELAADMPDGAEVVFKAKFGGGSSRGSAMREMTAELYPEQL